MTIVVAHSSRSLPPHLADVLAFPLGSLLSGRGQEVDQQRDCALLLVQRHRFLLVLLMWLSLPELLLSFHRDSIQAPDVNPLVAEVDHDGDPSDSLL